MSKYKRIAESLRQRIRSGMYGEDQLVPTTKRLAAEFGTSTVTIDRAIHLLVNEGLVVRTPGIGTKVQNASDAAAARGQSRLVGALVATQSGTLFWERVIEGVNDVLRPAGLSLMIGYHKQELQVALEHARLFREQGVEVLLFAPFDRPTKDEYETDNSIVVNSLRDLGMEVIMLDRYIQTVPGHLVSEHSYDVGRSMMEKVFRMGYGEPICFSTHYVSVIGAREGAFVDGCLAAGIQQPERRIVRFPLTSYRNGYDDQVIATLKENPATDLICSMNSTIFNRVLFALANRTHLSPAISPRFVGFVDIELIDLDRVVAYVEQPVREMGRAAGRMVRHLISESSIEYLHSLVPCELRILGNP